MIAGFLIATAILTHQMKGQVLKSSALALVFALGEECRQVAGGIESIPAMRRKARVLQVRLLGDTVEFSGTPAGRTRTGSAESSKSQIEKSTETVITEEKI